jgi:steroid delta-isomerase-like uncharacterized protein
VAQTGRGAPPAQAGNETVAASPEEVARSVFAAFGAKDLEGAARFIHPDAVDDFVAIGIFEGREAILCFFTELFGAFPDFQLRVDRVVADDRSAVVQWYASGSFTGTPFQGIEATGRRAEVRGVDVIEIENGLIRHNTIYYDGAGFARDIGLLPRLGSRLDRATLISLNAGARLRQRLRRPVGINSTSRRRTKR